MRKSSITREVARNADEDRRYTGATAHRQYLERRLLAKIPSLKIQNDPRLRRHIQRCLAKRDSPEQIAGRISRKNIYQTISHESIYSWIFGEAPALKKQLRRIGTKGKYRRKRGTKKREEAREEGKIKRIDARPAVVETRERIGDWEGDTIIGKDKLKRLATSVERKSGYGFITKLDVVTMRTMHDALERRFRAIPKKKRHTYTYDNGTELGKADEMLERRIGMAVYRAYPYHSWERGSNENWNGLIRDFFPKGTDFATITDKEVKRVESNLNHRPRRRLGYLTPHEVFVLGMVPA
ncbi:MAG: IS30 family transposase [Sedimentisphaerales bacterium]|nr:IS30 family transposase [Sedimentisphaerales bacterium]